MTRAVAQDSEYNRGLYNGIELMNSMLTNTKPELIEKKSKIKPTTCTDLTDKK